MTTTRRKRTKTKSEDNGAASNYKSQLWQMADALRGSMDASEYKHVVLGLIFLKYVSDGFEEMRARLEGEVNQNVDPDDRDEYRAEHIFWVPEEARWDYLKSQAHQPTIGVLIDHAMACIEADNPALKNVLPQDYHRPALEKHRLGQLIDLISNIKVGDAKARARDVLGQVYEYFLKEFAGAEGRRGGEFYTPSCIVKLLVEMIQPFKGRVYDPCCGSAGMFVQSVEFINAHASGNGNGGRAKDDISIFGQESNYTTWRLARMNLAIRGIEGSIEQGDTFRGDLHPELRADYILANPPFNISEWGGDLLTDDLRWQFGVPPSGNANFAWLQHMVHHLSRRGVAGVVLANGSMSSVQNGEGKIRENLIERDVVDCMVALPGQIFHHTPIPACLWFLSKDRMGSGSRDRRGEILFIDARKMGHLIDRTHRELSSEDIARIANTYHAWRDLEPDTEYADVPGFCKSATIDDVRKHGHVLTPGRYVGVAPTEEDSEPFQQKMTRLTAQWRNQSKEARQLDEQIEANLSSLGF